GRLPERPLEDLVSEMEKHGVAFSSHKLPFEISGTLSGGTYELAGNVSSQYITGLLLGLSAAGKSSQIRLTTELESSAYVDITLNALSKFGISIQRTEFGWTVPENQNFRSPEKLSVDGDWSNSAFFLAAGTSGRGITVTGLDTNSPQGDKSILKVFSDFGSETKITQNGVRILPSNLHGCTVDMRQIPDALPILAVLAATAEGQTHFVNAARLRLKESDRIATTAAMLRSLGIKTEEEPDGLTVFKGRFSGGIVDGAGDHRIVMAAAIAACNSTENVIIKGAEAVNKSYPSFFNDLKYLGGIANVI
ncbi:MAG: 3-phosphoshikimate 1-carboxyvinyltransferase, partial [Clostridia bacterium]|nr:3-phosphoshikimate 1-carboxyvinyltransferase [Clostridia bacterium]